MTTHARRPVGRPAKKRNAVHGAHDESATDSRSKLISAARHLFARHGVDRVSVREVAARAGVNSALIGYYFESKEGLVRELYRSHAEPLNAERIRLLEEAMMEAEPSLEEVIEAFVRPALEITVDEDEMSEFTRMRCLIAAENSALLESLVAENFDRITATFAQALHICLPMLSLDDILWRYHFLLGTVNYAAAGPQRIAVFSSGRCNPLDVDAMLRELVPFLAAGLRAPAASSVSHAFAELTPVAV